MKKKNPYDYGEVEINLVEYAQFFLHVIRKRKVFVLSFLLISFFAAVTIFVVKPRLFKNYTISEIISVPSLALVQNYDQLEFYNSELEGILQEVVQKINTGFYNHPVRTSMGIPNINDLNIKALYKKEQKYVTISLHVPEKQLAIGEKALVQIYTLIKNEFDPVIYARREIIKNKIQSKKLKRQNLIRAKNKNLESFEGSINFIELLDNFDFDNIIKNIDYSEQIITKRTMYLLNEFVFLRNLQSELLLLRSNYVGHKNKEEILYNKIKNIKSHLDVLNTGDLSFIDNEITIIDFDLRNLAIENKFLRNAELIQPPIATLYLIDSVDVPMKIFCFSLFGLIIGIVLAVGFDRKKVPKLFMRSN